MKKFVLLAIFGLICVVQSNVFAYTRSVPLTNLDSIVGNWYDSKGNLVLTISKDYKINGCKVIAAYFYEYGDNHNYIDVLPTHSIASYVYRIIEQNGYRDIEIEYYGSHYHEILVVDAGKMVLRKTKIQQYYESVGGIYLGMDKSQVLNLYGQPASINPNIQSRYNATTKKTENFSPKYSGYTLKYDKEGFDVKIVGDMVVSLKIYRNSNRHFDITGLSARDSYETFKEKYKAGVFIRPPRLDIGYGEEIRPDEEKGYVEFRILTM